MLIRMEVLKVTQAAAFILRKLNGFATRKRLLKLLYIADRELIAQTHRPLTGDRAVAMDHGPVLSHTYDLLKGEAADVQIWNRYIQQIGPYTHRLIDDPGVGRLSKLELAKLEELVNRYWSIDDDDLCDVTHEFAEWKRNRPDKKHQNPIPTEHLLEALGLGGKIEELRQATQADSDLDVLFASVNG